MEKEDSEKIIRENNFATAQRYLESHQECNILFLDYSKVDEKWEKIVASIYKELSVDYMVLANYYKSKANLETVSDSILVDKLKELGTLHLKLSEQYRTISMSGNSEFYEQKAKMHKYKSNALLVNALSITLPSLG